MSLDTRALVSRILELQDAGGRISWVESGLFDPWNHCEAAMGLICSGEIAPARRALDHLVETQVGFGGWQADMGCAVPMSPDGQRLDTRSPPQIVDLNFCAYPAVAVWRLYLATEDLRDLKRYTPMIARAADFVVAHQQRDGSFPWRRPDAGETLSDVESLLAGGASIYKSLECAAHIERALGGHSGPLDEARGRLGAALRERPEAFASKPGHAMDWYYPALCGVYRRAEGRERLASRWCQFVDRRWGCRCVAEEPWATGAETAELAIACIRAGAMRAADALLASLERHQCADGGLWMGRQFALNVDWPLERPSWTAGAALLALDSRRGVGRGARLFLDAAPEPSFAFT